MIFFLGGSGKDPLFFLSKNLGDIGYYSIQKGVEE